MGVFFVLELLVGVVGGRQHPMGSQVAFQFLIALVGRFSLCHVVLSVHCDQYIALHVRAVDRHARVRQAQQRLLGRMAVAVVTHADDADLRCH